MSTDLPTVNSAGTPRLREALLTAGFTADGLLELLGAPAYAALARSETVPALRATRGAGPLETLVRLFLLQCPVSRARAHAALPVDDALVDGWLSAVPGGEVAATVDIRPYSGPEGEDWWVVSDLGCAVGGAAGAAERRADVVLGVGGASTTLAGLTVRTPVGRALDIGCGSGIQALHASRHATQVTATDVNPRALAFTGLTLALSGASRPDLRRGPLFDPVAQDEPYDLIVSNPPFVISPEPVAEPAAEPGAEDAADRAAPRAGGPVEGIPGQGAPGRGRLTYRDGGMRGDDLCRTLVQNSVDHLAEGGHCHVLANWEHLAGEDWRDRLRSWVPRGCDAWIVQREVQDVTQYTELWLRDSGDHLTGPEEYRARYESWLDAFEERGTEAIGFGWITLRRSGAEEPSVVVEEWTHPVEQPLGEAVREHFARQDFLQRHDDAALLDTRFRLAEGVVQEQVGPPGAEDPEHVVLRQQRGMLRATRVDTVGAGFAGVCDGSLPAGRILDAIAQLVGEDAVQLRDRTPQAIRLLVEQGFLLPDVPH